MKTAKEIARKVSLDVDDEILKDGWVDTPLLTERITDALRSYGEAVREKAAKIADKAAEFYGPEPEVARCVTTAKIVAEKIRRMKVE